MIRAAIVLALVITGCGGGSHDSRFAVGSSRGMSLVGTWDATMSLAQPYQLELHDPGVKRICGTMAFVDNQFANVESAPRDSARQLGVYDLDLSLFGLRWLDKDSFPSAVTTATERDSNQIRARDSVIIVLNPGSQERIVLLGRYVRGDVTGEWRAQSSRGTAFGSFLLSPHDNTRQSAVCS